MSRLYNILNALAGTLKPSTLATSYTSNSYVGSTDFARIAAYEKDGVVYVKGNLYITANPQQNSAVTIGSITLPRNLLYDAQLTIPSASGGNGLVSVATNGDISIIRLTSTSWSGWARFSLSAPLAAIS